jgi:hypothetical protein
MGRGSSGQRRVGYREKRELLKHKHRDTVQDADDGETYSGYAPRNIGISCEGRSRREPVCAFEMCFERRGVQSGVESTPESLAIKYSRPCHASLVE